MPFTTNFPGLYSISDCNSEPSGSLRPLNCNNDILDIANYRNGSVSSPFMDLHLGYNKEAMKQTMLKHEAIFRDQIHELHRVHTRQKELMEEMKKNEFSKRQVSLETSEFLKSESKFGNKMLFDLQLPAAYEYVDSEEAESMEEGKVPELNKMMPIINPLKRNTSLHNITFNLGIQQNSCVSLKAKCSVDLNEPLSPEDFGYSEFNDFIGPVYGEKIQCWKPATDMDSDIHVLSENTTQNKRTRDDLKAYSYAEESGKGILDLNSSPQDDDGLSNFENIEPPVVTSQIVPRIDVGIPEPLGFERVPIVAVQALPCFNTSSVSITKKSNKGKKTNLSSCFKVCIDLNSSLNGDESYLTTPSVSSEIYLDAPASPENKESNPRRNDSDGNQTSPENTSGDYGESVEIKPESSCLSAAETIVSISSSGRLTYLDSSIFNPLEASPIGHLHWFAGIASSVIDDSENEFGLVLVSSETDKHDHNDDKDENTLDYFEAMTLQLTDTKEEEETVTPKLKAPPPPPPPPPVKPMSGRSRRGRQQKKDFQTEILPSLASLSRCEVTEDLQTIGGLMEAAGTHWETGYLRNAGRGRKRYFHTSETNIERRTVIDWGNVTRGRRGPRCRSSKRQGDFMRPSIV